MVEEHTTPQDSSMVTLSRPHGDNVQRIELLYGDAQLAQ